MKTAALWLTLFIAACSGSPQSKEEYLKERGVQYIKIGQVELTSRLLNTSPNADESNYSDSSYLYFDVTIDKLSEHKFDKEKIMYLDFDMQKDFVVASQKDSILPAFCQRIETGKSERFEYVVAIAKPKNSNTGMTLVYNDKIFGVGTVAFVYQANDLKNFEPKS